MDEVVFSGFDWDEANLQKCLKHGLSRTEIEAVFLASVRIRPDVAHSTTEERFQAIGKGKVGRFIFVVFTFREREGAIYIRPISARYMHIEEIRRYEEDNPDFRDR